MLSPTGDENGWRFNFLTNQINPLFMDVASDDRVILTLQYSTQWDTLAHVGGLFDADGDGVPSRSTTTASRPVPMWSARSPTPDATAAAT